MGHGLLVLLICLCKQKNFDSAAETLKANVSPRINNLHSGLTSRKSRRAFSLNPDENRLPTLWGVGLTLNQRGSGEDGGRGAAGIMFCFRRSCWHVREHRDPFSASQRRQPVWLSLPACSHSPSAEACCWNLTFRPKAFWHFATGAPFDLVLGQVYLQSHISTRV